MAGITIEQEITLLNEKVYLLVEKLSNSNMFEKRILQVKIRRATCRLQYLYTLL